MEGWRGGGWRANVCKYCLKPFPPHTADIQMVGMMVLVARELLTMGYCNLIRLLLRANVRKCCLKPFSHTQMVGMMVLAAQEL